VKSNVVIIGGGQAGCMTAIALRQKKYEGSILIINEENHLPYQRPPLSKGFLMDEVKEENLYLKSARYFEKNNIKLMTNKMVSEINTDNRTVIIDNLEVNYDKLSISTGSSPNKISLSCKEKGIHYLRSISDAKNIKKTIKTKKDIVLIGAGYIGLEIAASSIKNGLKVTILEKETRVMSRSVCSKTSAFIQKKHEQEGVKFLFNLSIKDIDDYKNKKKIICSNGEVILADAVIIGVGIKPNIQLAKSSNLECKNGIVVDEYGRTSNRDIYAAGDCTNHPNNIYKKMLRLESVHNAIEQAKTVAISIMGDKKPYRQVPWFWSNQYNLKIQIAGISKDYDEYIVKDEIRNKKLAVFYLKKNKLIAVDAINNPKVFSQGKKLIAIGGKAPIKELEN